MTSYAEGILSDVMLGPAIVEYLERINVVHESDPHQLAEKRERAEHCELTR